MFGGKNMRVRDEIVREYGISCWECVRYLMENSIEVEECEWLHELLINVRDS